jgi:Flp pilus assembly protein TadG
MSMFLRRASRNRRGVASLEMAVVMPVFFLLLMCLIIGGMGVFRYQEVAMLARQGARYASTHGYQYRQDAGLPIGTTSDWTTDITNNGVLPYVVELDSSSLTVTATWPGVINQPNNPDNWPGSKVDVTVSYQWTPAWFGIGPITLSSTSSMPITN